MAERQQAQDYLNKYSIMDLFDFLQSQIVYNQPEQPNKLVADILKKIKNNEIQFFDNEELEILFKKYEVLDRGYITNIQCNNALRNLGINEYIISQHPVEKEVTIDQFKDLVAKCFEMRKNKWKGA